MRNRLYLSLALVCCLSVSGCAPMGAIVDKIKGLFGISSAPKVETTRLPDGTYKIVRYLCNGIPTTNPHFDYVNNPQTPGQLVINDGNLSQTYTIEGCKININYAMTITDNQGNFRLTGKDTVRCSDQVLCEPIATKKLGLPSCDSPMTPDTIKFNYVKKSENPLTYILTVQSEQFCTLGSFGEDPIAWEITPN